MTKRARQATHDVKAQALPEAHGSLVGADHEVELDRQKAAAPCVLERMLAHALRDPTPECEEGTTPLRELVKWLHEKRDIQRARIRFAGTEISFTA